jgi:hypothetical protein
LKKQRPTVSHIASRLCASFGRFSRGVSGLAMGPARRLARTWRGTSGRRNGFAADGLDDELARGARLDRAEFSERFFGRAADDPAVAKRRSAAMGASMATSHAELRDAASDLAAAQQIIGLDRWRSFLADAQQRADDPAAVTALEMSQTPPDVAKDAIRPAYPVETAMGIAATAITGGTAAAVRAAGGAVLRQIMPGRSVGETPATILRPGGQPIGRAGTSEDVRELAGGQKAAEELFKRLRKDGKDETPPDYPGTLILTPDGSYIGYRPQSKSGPPTTDAKMPGYGMITLKFLGD